MLTKGCKCQLVQTDGDEFELICGPYVLVSCLFSCWFSSTVQCPLVAYFCFLQAAPGDAFLASFDSPPRRTVCAKVHVYC